MEGSRRDVARVDLLMNVRTAEEAEVYELAEIWYQGWQDAHAQILPAELRQLRTPESFRERMKAALDSVRVVGPSGAPVGFCMIKDDELYRYVERSVSFRSVAV
jgi:hypothetical protein